MQPPHIDFLRGLISKCSGYDFKFTALQKRPPQDMIFKYMMLCKWPDGKGGEKATFTRTPSYFHSRDLACLHKLEELNKIQMEDICITNNIFRNLSRRHVQELKLHMMWGSLTQTCRQLTQINVNIILNGSDTWIGVIFY